MLVEHGTPPVVTPTEGALSGHREGALSSAHRPPTVRSVSAGHAIRIFRGLRRGAHWPVPVETAELPGRYGTTRVTSAGPSAAQSLILLHGYSGASGMWYPVAGSLAEEHRVRAVDIMGEPGRSRHTGAALTSMDDLADWLAETFDLLGLSQADLCGQSLGSHLTLRFALAHPERVRRLVLLDPPDPMARILVLVPVVRAQRSIPRGGAEGASFDLVGPGLRASPCR
ncbi:alpha/beta fold hydrolase [Nocardia sp. NPDC050193]